MDLSKPSPGKRVAIETSGMGETKKVKQNNCSVMTDFYNCMNDCKENVNFEMPIDMSQGTKCSNIDERLPYQKNKCLDFSVRILREKLRNEETALLLLKKLQQSQLLHVVHTGSGRPLVGGSNQHSCVVTDSTITSQSNLSHRTFDRQQFVHHGIQQHLYPMSVQYAHHQESSHQGIQTHSQKLISSTAVPMDSTSVPHPLTAGQQNSERVLAQRQAFAKLAIRRQLEAALLKLPTPQFTPEEMPFIPTVGSYADFIALVGMEEAVSRILHPDAADKLAEEIEQQGALQCTHCQTDFTPLWKREDKDVNHVICEQCTTKSRKEIFRQEHTTRMKAAFCQALQLEQKLEALKN